MADVERRKAGMHPIGASQREGGRSAVVLAAEAEWMEREELRKGTKRKVCEKQQAGAKINWKEMIGREPTEADWTPLLDGGQGKNICIACEPAAKNRIERRYSPPFSYSNS
jgi:hypothetical protein